MGLKNDIEKTIFIASTNKGKLREFAAALPKGSRLCGLGDVTENERLRYGEPDEVGDAFVHNGLIKLAAALAIFVSESGTSLRPDVLLVDDSGLVVPQLDFEPGVHSAHYSGMPRDDARNRRRLAEAVGVHPSAGCAAQGDQRLRAYFVAALLLVDLRGAEKLQRLELLRAIEGVLRASNAVSSADSSRTFPSRAWELAAFNEAASAGKTSYHTTLTWPGAQAGVPCLEVFYGFCHGHVSDREQQLLPEEGHGYDAIFFPDECGGALSFASIPLQEKNLMSHRGRALAAALPYL